MRKALIPISILLLGGIACSTKKAMAVPQAAPAVPMAYANEDLVPPSTTRNPQQPWWVDNADRDDRLSAVGIADPNPLNDISFQRTCATHRALQALALKLQTRCEALYEQSSAMNEQGAGKKKDVYANQEIRSTMRNLVNVTLKGARIPSFWTDRQTGTLFVLARLDDQAADRIVQQAVIRQQNLDSGLDRLDAEMTRK